MCHFLDRWTIGQYDLRCTWTHPVELVVGPLGGSKSNGRARPCRDVGVDSITFKDMLPIVWALAIWGVYWKDSAVTVCCDNTGAVHSKIPRIMHLL